MLLLEVMGFAGMNFITFPAFLSTKKFKKFLKIKINANFKKNVILVVTKYNLKYIFLKGFVFKKLQI